MLLTPAAMRGQLLALAFVHPMFIGLAMAGILMTGTDSLYTVPRPAPTPAAKAD
jgi:hypothetical protein